MGKRGTIHQREVWLRFVDSKCQSVKFARVSKDRRANEMKMKTLKTILLTKMGGNLYKTMMVMTITGTGLTKLMIGKNLKILGSTM